MTEILLSPGRKYVPKFEFSSGKSVFYPSETLTFIACKYSPYDSAYAYEFLDESGLIKTWWEFEKKLQDSWAEYFDFRS